MLEKFKSLMAIDAVFVSLLLILVAVASFGLGRLSVVVESGVEQSDRGIEIIESASVLNNKASLMEGVALTVVASKSGSKYHLPTCPGADQIKASNKIIFESIIDAEAAGYTPAANCDF
jgi:hypothetical protein